MPRQMKFKQCSKVRKFIARFIKISLLFLPAIDYIAKTPEGEKTHVDSMLELTYRQLIEGWRTEIFKTRTLYWIGQS
jgi:hypothetical protein